MRHTITRCNKLLKRLWRKLHLLDHLDMELRLLLMISTCVLHNFSINHDDIDDNEDDGDGGPAIALQRRAEKKRVHIMGLL